MAEAASACDAGAQGMRCPVMTVEGEPARTPVQVLAQYLAADDRVWRRLLDLHVADRTGHCAGCNSAGGGAPVWPCTLRAIGLEVRAINRR